MNTPIPPTIPGSSNNTTSYSNTIKTNEILLNKDSLEISCGSSDSSVIITKSQGTVQVTVTADIGSSAYSTGLMNFVIGEGGPLLTSQSSIFLNFTKTDTTGGIPIPINYQLVEGGPGEGYFNVYIANVDISDTVSNGTILTLAYMIIN